MAIPDLAEYLGTSVRHIRYLVAKKQVPVLKVGQLVRFRRSEIEDWLEDRRPGVSAAPALDFVEFS